MREERKGGENDDKEGQDRIHIFDSKEEKINKLGGDTFPNIIWSVLFTGSVFSKSKNALAFIDYKITRC